MWGRSCNVHKAAQEFGVDNDDTVYSGVVVSYNADALKWTVQYDHGAPLTTEEYTQQQVATHHAPRRPAR
jgi:hypothetical protein